MNIFQKWAIIVFCFNLGACASVNIADSKESQTCHLATGKSVECFDRPRVDETSDEHFDEYKRAYSHEPWFAKSDDSNPRPRVGIASGGGGTKASAFSMGVIKRLVQDDSIKKVDIISSVSGGGHPVAFLYGRARYAQLVDNVPDCEIEQGMLNQHDIDYQELKCFYTDLNQVKVHFPRNDLDSYGLKKNAQIIAVPSNDLIAAADNGIDLPADYVESLTGRNYHLAKICQTSDNNSACDKNSPSALPGWDAAVDWEWGNNTVQEPPFKCKADKLPVSLDENISNVDRNIHAAHRSYTWQRCWQDILSTWSSEVSAPDSITLANRVGAWSSGIGFTALTLPPHHLANTLFDWQWDVSPLYYRQRQGNERLSMNLPKHTDRDKWPEKYIGDTDDSIRAKCEEFEPEKVKSEKLSFSDLRCANKLELPMWVINATTPTRSHFNLSRIELTDMDDFRFEFTPYGFGSHRYGYITNQNVDIYKEHKIELPRALSSSYAFLDSRQRVVPGSKAPASALGYLLLNGGIHTLNLDWGISIPNYNMTKSNRTAYKFLPAPLNYYSRFNERALRSHIPLADGGINRDGLGILPLLERRTENIIIINQGASISDLCQFNKFLQSENLQFVFDGDPSKKADPNKRLPRIHLRGGEGELCTKDFWDQNKGLNFKHWTQPVWKGHIEAIDKVKTPNYPKTKIFFVTANTFLSPDSSGLEPCMKAILDSEDGSLNSLREKSRFVNEISASNPHHNYPPSLCAWMHRNIKENDAKFPEHGMGLMTVDSTQQLSTAYTDLGWFLAGGLSEAFEK